jgi:hypothetical protein
VEKKAETDDSAPSSTDTEDDANDLLKPKALVFEQKAADKSLEKAADKSLDIAADKSLDKATKVKGLAESDRVRIQEQKKRAKEILREKHIEAFEVQAATDMATGDDTMMACYNELVHTLVGGPVMNDGSPIIKKRKASSRAVGKSSILKKSKDDEEIKTYSMGGVVVQTEGASSFKMLDIIKNAQQKGAKILDDATGNLMKKVPCGFYPSCVTALEKDGVVIGGIVIQPPDHRRINKLVYLCGEHKVDMQEPMVEERNTKESLADMVDKDNAVDDADCSLDELEASVGEEQLEMSITFGGGRKQDSKVEKEEIVAGVKESTEEVMDDKEGASDDEFMSQSLFIKRP